MGFGNKRGRTRHAKRDKPQPRYIMRQGCASASEDEETIYRSIAMLEQVTLGKQSEPCQQVLSPNPALGRTGLGDCLTQKNRWTLIC